MIETLYKVVTPARSTSCPFGGGTSPDEDAKGRPLQNVRYLCKSSELLPVCTRTAYDLCWVENLKRTLHHVLAQCRHTKKLIYFSMNFNLIL